MNKNLLRQFHLCFTKTICIVFCLVTLTSCSLEPEKAPPLPSSITWINRPNHYQAPDFMASKPVFLEFLTDQCQACLEQLPDLKKLKKSYEDKIDFITIYTPSRLESSTLSHASQFITDLKIDSPVIFDEKAKILNAYHVTGWPTSILISKGEVKNRFYGVTTFDDINSKIEKLIEE